MRRNPNGPHRSDFNSDKTKLLRTSLYEIFEDDFGTVPEDEDGFTVAREGDVYCVFGPRAEKIVASTNCLDYESLQFFQRSLRDSGIIDELEKAGIQEGETVRMSELEFEYMK